MAVEKTVVIVVEGDEAIREVEKLNDKLGQTDKELESINEKGGQGFENAAKGAGKFKTAINAVGTALKAAGIGLALAALAKIADIFRQSPQGARIISRALNTVNIVMLELYHNAALVGDLLSALFRGDFVQVGALSAMFKEQIGNAIELGKAYTDMEAAVKALDDSLILVTGRQLRVMEQNRVIADDEKRTVAERFEAAQAIEDAAKVLFDARTIRFQKEVEMLDSLTVLNEEQKTRRFELLAEIETAEEEYNARLAELLGVRRGIQERAGEALFTDEALDELREGYNKIESETEVHLDNMDALYAGYSKQKERHDSEAAEAAITLAQEEAEARSIAMDSTADALTRLSVIAGNETAAGKALAIAASLINVYQGITKAIAQGGFAGIAMGASVAIAGFAAIKNIIDTPIPGQSSSSGTASPSVPAAPSFNVVGATQTSALESALLTNGVKIDADTPVKTYVVASEVTTAQALDRAIESNASF